MRKYTILFLFPLLIMSCKTIKDLASSIDKPRLSVDDVRVTGFNFHQMQLIYDIKIENPNAVALQMLGYDYNLDLNGSSFIKGDQTEQVDIDAGGESIIQVPMTLDFSDVYQAISGLSDQDETTYNFLSHLRFDLPVLGATEIPVRKEGSLPLLKLPRINVQNLKVQNLSFSSADLALQLAFDNPNGIGFDINQLTYDLVVNGRPWAEGMALQDVSIRENGTTQLTIPLSLNLSEIGRSGYRILSGSESLEYQLRGTFNFNALHELLGSTNFTFDRSGQLSIN
ncbi:LEA type 2 family protein [Fodinibius sediminis]|uniref:LEA14-like dessication related protein n=1 Tax=Fodinibius sediminis TaxID=1214077 RepID=A0A521D9C1_9BACT|nr:LEA type 2 family protein [Fodinibius sediminis]SMO68314.1 LEA14-like dessication related protein [Fodinibius sediminis]